MPRKTKETGNSENEIVKIANAIKEVLSRSNPLKKAGLDKSKADKKSSKTAAGKKASTKSTSTKKASTSKSGTTKKTTSTKTSTKKVSESKSASTKKASESKSASAKKTSTSKSTSTKKASTPKATTDKKASSSKSVATKKASAPKSTTSKKASTSKSGTTKKASTSKSGTTKKASKSTTAKKSTTSRRSTSKKTTVVSDKQFSAEYYDLPFRYNKTIIRILAQTPKNLFIYWEISDEDREALKRQYGEYFFEITKPVLIIYNETLNYTFEIDIDDFANSWYLHVDDSNSEYKVELGRRPIPVNYNYIPDYDVSKNGPIEELKTPYIYISSSNELDAPNDKILFNNLKKILFRNVKTNELIEKDILDFPYLYKDGSFIKLYQELYKEEIKNDSFNLYNPSSGNIGSGSFSSRFY